MKDYEKIPIKSSLLEMLDAIGSELGNSADLNTRRLSCSGGMNSDSIAIVYMENMVDESQLDEFVIKPLLNVSGSASAQERMEQIRNKLLATGAVTVISHFKQLFQQLLAGNTVILIDGCTHTLSAGTAGGVKRNMQEPRTEQALRGPREGFTETLLDNTALIRRKIRSPRLWLERKTIGKVTQTPVGIMYMKDLADEGVLKELRYRLDCIHIDGILESGYIEELISDQKWTPFPTIINNERPDVIVSYLLEGRVAILIEGTPFVLVVPTTLNAFFQAAEDYYHNYQMATFLRMLRFVSFVIALLMPSIYVAIVGYHQEMIPTPLLLKLAAQREGVPFPAYLEAFFMEFVFEILREAVLRMPGNAGNAVPIVGGLVIGQSVVEAGIVSSAVVIVVSFTAIASFVAPVYSLGIAARLLRFILLLAASTLGFYGIALVVLLLLLHLSNLRSFGLPYLKPFAPFNWRDMKDSLIRAPIWMFKQRPHQLAERNHTRQDSRPEPRDEPSQ
ncbi:spore germination protein [Paenibacillus chungangensis]|uniref:Spore germination protein n=1 Tax=Paenibacillus chungangensis TaxID=696535 RepID=A0ABW3HK43_9BACL